jgi:hypothetical protein
MPNLYRSMRRDNGVPQICDVVDCLGVRSEGKHPDVFPDGNGNIAPGGGGMSVSVHDTRAIPRWRLPLHFGGENSNPLCTVWTLSSDAVHLDVVHRENEPYADGSIHAQVEPRAQMTLAHYRTCLGSTQADWHEEVAPQP